jgi:uncharacterized membrane protein
MPNLAAFHPQIVHFVVALLLLGVAMRAISITGRLKFTDHIATFLLLVGTVAAVLAVRSGLDAHGPVERIPGLRDLVVHHEDHGILARNFFLAVAVIELLALGMGLMQKPAKYIRVAWIASALVGLVGSFQLFETAKHGGEIVYSYGGGPGLRTGDPRDVERLLLAGLFNQAQADRKAGKSTSAAELIETMARRFPGDTLIRLLHAESMLIDGKRPADALAAVDLVGVDPENARLVARQATIKADIHLALGQPELARSTLAPVVAKFPTNTRLKAKLDSIK